MNNILMNSLKRKCIYILAGMIKIILIVVTAYPFLWMVFTSFKPHDETLLYPPVLFPAHVVCNGFRLALNHIPVFRFSLNTIIVSFSVFFFQYLIIIPAAYGFARYHFKGSRVMFSIVLLGFMIPQQVTFVPVFLMFSKFGLLQSYVPQTLPFIANPFGIFLLRQYFRQIPEEIIEAARLDNASESKIITELMIPMAKPALLTIGLLSFISIWNSYFWPLIMTTRDTFRPLAVGISMLTSLDGEREWNMIMAGNMFLVIPILIVYLMANKKVRNAFIYYSGIK
jgi:sn-glycerol 3-phosphate transport system permease protein